MIVKLSLIFLLTLVSMVPLEAADNIEWLEKCIDFGVIKETDGVKYGEFRLVNHGRKKLEISQVKATCGCTELEYSQGKIGKGDTAVIKVAFDPFERPGKFDKGIYVFINDEKIPVNLRIKGVVLASPETLMLFFPYGEGDLRSDTDTVAFGEVTKGVRTREFIDIYNSGNKEITPKISSKDEALSWSIEPESIGPGETATATIYLDSSRVMWLGRKTFKLYLSEEENKELEVPVTAILIPADP
ncbi:MAG: DUF1573 domain-containing protein [Muribaculaceae bacterium]|nr:DUF1573 domain-containing protein [Muribaculaceae bacterium]